jgi:hypothetical protein
MLADGRGGAEAHWSEVAPMAALWHRARLLGDPNMSRTSQVLAWGLEGFFRHSGESRNPGRPLTLDPGFRRGDAWGDFLQDHHI